MEPGAEGPGAEGPAPQPAAPTADADAKRRTNRAPTASDMLGLGKRDGVDGDTPEFLQKPAVKGPSPLFAGRIAQPSTGYLEMKGEVLEVSPLSRHWGVDPVLGSASGQPTSVAAPVGPKGTNIFGTQGTKDKEDPPPDEDTPRKKVDEPKYPLLLYRIDRTSGEVEVFDRIYASKDARRAAQQFATRQGFSPNKPSPQTLAAIKLQLATARRKKAEEATACPFRAQWTEAGVARSQCFKTQAAVDAFMARRRAANTQKAPATAPGTGGKAPVKQPNRPAPTVPEEKTEHQGGIQPVPLGN